MIGTTQPISADNTVLVSNVINVVIILTLSFMVYKSTKI